MNTPVEDDLRAELTRRAGTVAVQRDPYALVTARVVRDRRRHLLVGAITTALVLLAGILSAPMVTKLAGPDLSPSDSPETWPVRGELADDPGVRTYLDRIYKGDAEELQVLFAGDVADRRYVIVRSDGDPAIVALVSPAGTYADKAAGELVPGIPGQTAWAFVDRRQVDKPTTVFLLAAPGLDAGEYSAGPIVAEDGRMVRRWGHLEREDDGVFVGRAQYDPSWQFRARAAKGKRVEVDVDAAFLFSRQQTGDARLEALAAAAATDQHFLNLGTALRTLERSYLGPGAITSVSIRWLDQQGPVDSYAGIAVDVSASGSIEALVRDDGNIMQARPVARGQAWTTTPKPDTLTGDGSNPRDTLDVPSTVGERMPY